MGQEHHSLNDLIDSFQAKGVELLFQLAGVVSTAEALFWQGYDFEQYLRFTEAVGHFLGVAIADLIQLFP
eukprot:CAMPEP_0170540310 /NCGR_PEP_ID=MMETSP0211-20121228/329_1 /TAXON_ID=311385 /ORGANISM="Pseudokeronopsis sp., Strain OXSARD2" /LENGTH=69 /DNA_ID=CAMNT_0010842665 /DNA_START=415 /DNA_END=624 /DNA_ORIENTATION=+